MNKKKQEDVKSVAKNNQKKKKLDDDSFNEISGGAFAFPPMRKVAEMAEKAIKTGPGKSDGGCNGVH